MVLAVGLVLLIAAVPARGSWRCRAVVAAAGGAWLAASVLPGVVLVHQALLLVLLVVFPDGRVRGWGHGSVAVAAVPVALLLVPQPGVATLFALAGGLAARRVLSEPAERVFPLAAGSALAAVLGGSWGWSRLSPASFDPTVALLVYESAVLATAVGFVVASRLVDQDRSGLAGRLLPEDTPADLDGLTELLRTTLRDPDLVITRPGAGSPAEGGAHRRDGGHHLVVRDGERSLAEVWHRPGILEDAAVADAVEGAVRLVALNLQRREELQTQSEFLRLARARVVAAADRQRSVTAGRLRAEVIDPLARTAAELRSALSSVSDPVAAESMELVVGELEAGVEDVRRLVAGAPPSVLGGGRLQVALHQLAGRSPVPVTLSGSASADPAREEALYYACCEALVNAEKHARASRITVRLSQDDRSVTVTVVDDGRGGADPAGSGLRGLADRLAVCGGRLRVESPPGAGTTVTASVPR